MQEAQAKKAISTKFLSTWKYLLGLNDWDITIKHSVLEERTFGEVATEPAHKSAMIIVDISKHKTTEELQKTVRHELFHLTHSHWEAYSNAVSKHLAPAVSDSLDEIATLGAEEVVLKIERLLQRLNIDVKGNCIL